jgi:hypothetical protein
MPSVRFIEKARTRRKIKSIGFHLRIIGQPGRIGALHAVDVREGDMEKSGS